jgi:hypothetical protein
VLARPWRVVGALAGVLALTVMSMVIPLGAPAPVAHAAGSTDCPTDPCTKDKTASGGAIVDGTRHPYPGASVTVSQTKNIQQRQVIHVSWNQFQPSDNLQNLDPNGVGVDNPVGENQTSGINYPVVLVECWGTDTPDKPMDPTHCQGPPAQYPGGHRLSAQTIYGATNGGGAPNPTTDVSAAVPTYARYGPDLLGFTSVDGVHYLMRDPTRKGDGFNGTDLVPPSLQSSSDALPGNAVVSSTASSGSRKNVEFEVRGGSDLPVLGCSYRQPGSDAGACTLEVIPIVRPFCDPNLWTNPDQRVQDVGRAYAKKYCNRVPYTGGAEPGNPFVQSDDWWLGSIWKNRFSFPLHMAPQPNDCPMVDPRPTVTVQGSEAATTFMSSWNQHFCLDPRSTFKLTHSNTPESTARMVLNNGDASGIFTSLPVTGSPKPVVHAPVAVTGWTVAYKLDQYDTTHEKDLPHKVVGPYTNLTLSPLLLAKLMTESYSGTCCGMVGEPALSGNPASFFKDPEFTALNPGFYPPHSGPDETGVIWANFDSDAFAAMFSYVDADPVARAWLNGKPDSYSGMVVNPAYRGLSAPQMAFQPRDTWTPQNSLCKPPLSYYDQISQMTPTLESAAVAVLSRKPQYQECKQLTESPPILYGWRGHTASQPIGQRNVIAFTTVGLAERYGLSMAKLQSPVPGARGVGPSGWEGPVNDRGGVDTLAAALGYTKTDKDTGVVSPDPSVFPFNGAYPGVLPVYAAIPTCRLDSTLANQYADMLTFAAGDGQTPGTGAGNLPPGYTPLPKVYADYTRAAAQAVRDQKCVVPPPPADLAGAVRDQLGMPAPGTAGSDGSNLGNGVRAGASPAGGNGTPGAGNTPGSANTPGTGTAPSSVTARPGTVAATRGTDSWLAGWGLALLLGVGLLAGVAVPLVQVSAQPGHPVRRFFASAAAQTSAMFHRNSS